jgi:hypothetical protein
LDIAFERRRDFGIIGRHPVTGLFDRAHEMQSLSRAIGGPGGCNICPKKNYKIVLTNDITERSSNNDK